MDHSKRFFSNRMSATSDSTSLGILDLDDMSDFSMTSPLKTKFKESIIKAAEHSKLKSTSVIQSKMVKNGNFKIPNETTTNTLLNSKRLFAESSRSRCDTDTNILCDTPTKDNSTVSNFHLNSRYLRLCSDSEWRDSSDCILPTAKNTSWTMLPTKDTSQAADAKNEDLPAPSFSNKLPSLEINSIVDFRNEEISARSSLFAHSTEQRTANSNNSDANTEKFPWYPDCQETAKCGSENLFTSAFGAGDLRWSNEIGFGNDQLSDIGFEAAGDASKFLREEEVQFEEEHEFMVPENMSEALAFSTSRENFPPVTKPSLCNATALFEAQSNPLGNFLNNENLQRPYFGLDINSPVRTDSIADATINRQSSVPISENANNIADLIQHLSLDIPTNQKDGINSTIQTTKDKNLSKIEEELPSPSVSSTSSKSTQTNYRVATITRCHSASDADYLRSLNAALRKCHSAENVSNEKQQSSEFAAPYSNPSLFARQHSASDLYTASCRFCLDHQALGFDYGNPRVNLFQQQQRPPECLRGPVELLGGYSCWGSHCKMNVPVINPSNRVLRCSFSIVTTFLSSQRVSPDRIDLVLPSESDIPPQSSKEFAVNFTAIEEGTIHIWIKVATESPRDNTLLGAFICHLTMNVENPKIEAMSFDPQHGNNNIQFAITSPDEETQIQFLRIVSRGKAAVPLLIFLQTEVTQEFVFIFPERQLNDLVLNSNHSIQLLFPTIILCKLHPRPNSETFILLPVTVFKKSKEKLRGFPVLTGTVTISLQCPNKVDQDLCKISLCAKMGICPAPPNKVVPKMVSGATKSSRVNPLIRKRPSRKMQAQKDSPPKVSNVELLGSKVTVKEPAEIDIITPSHLEASSDYATSVNQNLTVSLCDEVKWFLEPQLLRFTEVHQRLCFHVRNTSDDLFWAQIYCPEDVFVVEPMQALSRPYTNITFQVRLLTRKDGNCVHNIGVTCDGINQVVKVFL